jgi:hypothetical protein
LEFPITIILVDINQAQCGAGESRMRPVGKPMDEERNLTMNQSVKILGATLIAGGLLYLLANAPQTGAALLLTSVAAFVIKEMALGHSAPTQPTHQK